MSADPILVLAWLALAHLLADFVLQNEVMVLAKRSSGLRAVRGLLAHGGVAAICLFPLPFAYGTAGWSVVVVVFASHMIIDRTKVLLTRRAEASALAAAHRRREGPAAPEHLGRAWTPVPAGLFALDQLAHLAVMAWAWAVWLAPAPLGADWLRVVDGLLGGWDRAVVHDVVLAIVVGASLVIANTRGGALFVGTLVRPAEIVHGPDTTSYGAEAEARISARTAAGTPAAAAAGRARGWSFRVGPLEGRVAEDPPATATAPAGPPAPGAASARVGATIGILERLLIVVFILTGVTEAIGFVVAAKTIARFRLLEDREFAEYYLLGTLASVSVALVTALLARAALGL